MIFSFFLLSVGFDRPKTTHQCDPSGGVVLSMIGTHLDPGGYMLGGEGELGSEVQVSDEPRASRNASGRGGHLSPWNPGSRW